MVNVKPALLGAAVAAASLVRCPGGACAACLGCAAPAVFVLCATLGSCLKYRKGKKDGRNKDNDRRRGHRASGAAEHCGDGGCR